MPKIAESTQRGSVYDLIKSVAATPIDFNTSIDQLPQLVPGRLCKFPSGDSDQFKSIALMDNVTTVTNSNKMSARATINTPDIDNQNDVILPEGGDFKNYAKNPVVLWYHGWAEISIPLGTSENPETGDLAIEVKPNEVTAECFFSQVFPVARQVFELVHEKTIRAVSLRSKPTSAKSYKLKDGTEITVYDGWSLIEWSWCPISVNPHAVAKSLMPAAMLSRLQDAIGEQGEAIHKVLQRGTLASDPIIPELAKSLMPYAPQAKGNVAGYRPEVNEMPTDMVLSVDAEIVKSWSRDELAKACSCMSSYDDSSRVLITEAKKKMEKAEKGDDYEDDTDDDDVEPEAEASEEEMPAKAGCKNKAGSAGKELVKAKPKEKVPPEGQQQPPAQGQAPTQGQQQAPAQGQQPDPSQQGQQQAPAQGEQADPSQQGQQPAQGQQPDPSQQQAAQGQQQADPSQQQADQGQQADPSQQQDGEKNNSQNSDESQKDGTGEEKKVDPQNGENPQPPVNPGDAPVKPNAQPAPGTPENPGQQPLQQKSLMGDPTIVPGGAVVLKELHTSVGAMADYFERSVAPLENEEVKGPLLNLINNWREIIVQMEGLFASQYPHLPSLAHQTLMMGNQQVEDKIKSWAAEDRANQFAMLSLENRLRVAAGQDQVSEPLRKFFQSTADQFRGMLAKAEELEQEKEELPDWESLYKSLRSENQKIVNQRNKLLLKAQALVEDSA